MKLVKIVGYCASGVAVGVAAVALAPFTGGGSVLGAASLAGSLLGAEALAVGAAVVGGAAGAAAGVAGDAATEASRQSDINQGRNEERARHTAEMYALKHQVTAMVDQIANRDQFIVAAFGLGIACASISRKLTDNLMEELDWLICGIGTRAQLPAITQNKISEMRSNPPSTNSAKALIKKHAFTSNEHEEIFNIIINTVAEFTEGNLETAHGF